MRIDQWLDQASTALREAGIPSHRLDAEVLLAAALKQNRPYLHAHNDELLTAPRLATAEAFLAKRRMRMPVAYILESKEFYGHSFHVTPDTLIPRPETETLVELLLLLPENNHASLIDVGTGSGAIAITLKLARPTLDVYATDISPEALAVARQNAERLGADVAFVLSDLLDKAPVTNPTYIVANLPYVDRTWERSPETDFEPAGALFADDGGLALIKRLISEASRLQSSGGYLALEADPVQHQPIKEAASTAGYSIDRQEDYALLFRKR